MKDLNIINKLLTIIFVVVAVFLNDDEMFIYILSSIGIICCINSKNILCFIFFIIPIVVPLSNFEFDLINISKVYDLSLVIGIVVLVINNFTILQRRYIFDNTLYKLKDYKKTKKHFRRCYYEECFNNNLNDTLNYKNITNSKYLNNQAFLKTEQDLKDIYLLNKLRFYQIYNKKHSLFPDRWKKYDTIYLVIIIIIFSMIVCIS